MIFEGFATGESSLTFESGFFFALGASFLAAASTRLRFAISGSPCAIGQRCSGIPSSARVTSSTWSPCTMPRRLLSKRQSFMGFSLARTPVDGKYNRRRRRSASGGAQAVEKGDVDAPVRVALEEFQDRRRVLVELGKAPIPGSVVGVDEQAAVPGIEIGLVLGNPEIDVHRRRIGVHSQSRKAAFALITPHHLQRQAADHTRQALAQLPGEAQQQLRAEAVEKVGAEISRLDVVPDRAFPAEAPQRLQRLRGEQAVDDCDVRLLREVARSEEHTSE